jgi:hypothetical protein
LEIDNYPDPEIFRDELRKHNEENIDQLFLGNSKVPNVLCKLTEAQYIHLHYDSKVITVFGDQENAKEGYNPVFKLPILY